MRYKLVYLLPLIIVFLCVSVAISKDAIKSGQLKITSPAFKDNESIPKKYTCDGKDISPPIIFENVPREAKSLVLIVDDPDAPMGTWVHWVLWNIDPKLK
ncbi:MAG: YbhB/YbcL family Raf kinase inhibitor-like protein, partial [Proteobacteria bacterium]|nr:YbhB/YbcL family Raf kinase inhibitor-like protein [Pseudomonadota bacterium]